MIFFLDSLQLRTCLTAILKSGFISGGKLEGGISFLVAEVAKLPKDLRDERDEVHVLRSYTYIIAMCARRCLAKRHLCAQPDDYRIADVGLNPAAISIF